jgi:hypothetical protein
MQQRHSNRGVVFCAVGAEMLQAEQVSGSLSELVTGLLRLSYCCEKLVPKARDSSGTEKNGNIRR